MLFRVRLDLAIVRVEPAKDADLGFRKTQVQDLDLKTVSQNKRVREPHRSEHFR